MQDSCLIGQEEATVRRNGIGVKLTGSGLVVTHYGSRLAQERVMGDRRQIRLRRQPDIHVARPSTGTSGRARSLRRRKTAAAMREKPVHFDITDCARWTTLGLSLLPNCPRLSHISLRGLLRRRLLGARRMQLIDGSRKVV
jgi:hypothetical protein